MKKINCDFCNEDISDDYDTEYNEVDAYDNKKFDLCKDCLEKFWDIRSKCGSKYEKLKMEHEKIINKEMMKFYKAELKKLKKEE